MKKYIPYMCLPWIYREEGGGLKKQNKTIILKKKTTISVNMWNLGQFN